MTVRAFRLAYDGAGYHGFQRQPDIPTVEGALFDALASLGALDASGADDATSARDPTEAVTAAAGGPSTPTPPPKYSAAGRTDAGVSALAQTVSFRCPDWLSPSALNAELPADVRAWASADVDDGFHARYDALCRTYVYHYHAPVRDPSVRYAEDDDRGAGDSDGDAFDDDLARAAAGRLAGRHDFHNLTPDDDGTVRELSTGVDRDGEFLRLRFAAGGFARQLVRRCVTLIADVATGSRAIEDVDRLLGTEPIDGPDGVAPAPAAPLVLQDVTYPTVEFAVDVDAAGDARAAFARRYAERRAAAEVAGVIRDGVGHPGNR